MVTNASDGEVTMNAAWDLRGMSTDTKPTDVPNGSTFFEVNTGKVFAFDGHGKTWYEL